tara:strand:- start:309 stop:479 length:171 start_codon:yes stop_codon:yes gene_type:complete
MPHKQAGENKQKQRKPEKMELKESEVIQWLEDLDYEMIRWMTEGTSPNNTPRSDCG